MLLELKAGSADDEAALGALRAQLLAGWTACLLLTPSCPPEVVAQARAAVEQDERLSLLEAAEPPLSSDEVLVVATSAVRLREHALYVFAAAATAAPALRLLYADEDCLGPDGTRDRPWFKPSFSPELLRHADYIGACAALRGAAAQGFAAHAAISRHRRRAR